MLFKKHLQLFILLSTALFVFSCITVDKSLGDDYVPNNQDLKIKYIEFDLPLIAKSEDSLQAYSSTTGVLGYIKTKEFGNIEIANVGNISQPYTEMRFGKDPIIKSVFLNLVVTSTSTFEDGQANIPQNINVYRTIKPLDTTQIYCNSFNPSMYESTSLNSSNSVFFGADSIKIFLKNEFGTEILNATEEELDSVELFINKFRGLYLTCSAPETETGGRLNYFNSSYSSLVLTYNFQPEWEDNMARKDTSVVLNFGSSLTVSPSYYSKNLNNNEPSLTLPAQGLAGAKPYISGQKLRGIIKEWADKNDIKLENLIIARASYSLPFEYPADLDMTYYPSALFPAYRDTINNSSSVTLAKKNYVIIDDVYDSANPNGAINKSLKEYAGDFSGYLQGLVNKNESEVSSIDDIWFAPISSAEDAYGNVYYNTDTQYYSFGFINGQLADRTPKIKLLYTTLK